MHRWNRNVLEWDFRAQSGLGTTLPSVDHNGAIKEGQPQKLHGIRAVSLPERLGRIEISLYPSVNLHNHAGEEHIFNRLEVSTMKTRRQAYFFPLKWGDGAWRPLIIKFRMDDGESFCDTVIDLVREILERSGVEDTHKYWLGYFTHKQATFVRFENSWISFVRSLRMQHQLPLDYVSDEREIPLVEERDLS